MTKPAPKTKLATRTLSFVIAIALLANSVLALPGAGEIAARSTRQFFATASPMWIGSGGGEPASGYNVGEGSSAIPLEAITGTIIAHASKLRAGVVRTLYGPEGIKVPNPPSTKERISNAAKSLSKAVLSRTNANTELTETEPRAVPTPVPGAVRFDFDGDGKADIGRWHSQNYELKVKNSNGGSFTTYTLGSSTIAKPAAGDFNGDGKTDPGVFNAGTWTYKPSPNPSATPATISLGTTGDIPVAGDYDGDGTTDAAVFRPSTGDWFVKQSSNGSTVTTNYGVSTDIPVPGNYDGDAYTDKAVYRGGTWYLNRTSLGTTSFGFGVSIDIPVAADYDGDGVTDYAIYRPTTGEWYVKKSSNGGDEYNVLGVPGDIAVPSAYTKQSGAPVTGYELATVRTSPKNKVGGTDLYSQNFSWGANLVSLPGRSGLDLNIGMGYNSLVWVKHGSSMILDPDENNLTPGFQYGLPLIEPIYYDTDKSKWVFMMVGPDGGRTEYRQTSASTVYESGDSSYRKLVTVNTSTPNAPVEDIQIKVYGPDGTQMHYEWLLGSYRCKQIKDRNGNFITVAYHSNGRINTVTDTLGRVITFNYDSGGFPTSITQTWKDSNGEGPGTTTHTWATFSYTTKTLDINFDSNLTAYGAFDNQVIKVLEKVTYADGAYAKFFYNGYAQVWKVENYAGDNHKLSHVRTNLESVPSGPLDCPKATWTKTWVENFNVSGMTNQEVVVETETATDNFSLPNYITGSGMKKVTIEMDNHPDNLLTKVYFHTSGYKEGLVAATEECVTESCLGSDRKRYSWNDWTQDEVAGSYIRNPRVKEHRVGDESNTRMTQIEYLLDGGGYLSINGLPVEIKTFDANTTSVLRSETISYNLNSAYTSRYILNLPSETKTWAGTSTSGTLLSKVTYGYDEGDFSDSSLNQSISPTQHDATSYGSSFVTGRGLVTSVTRWDAQYPTSFSYAIASSTKYNTAGSPVAKISPWYGTNTRTTKIGYSDSASWNDGVSRNTHAYPTTFTDPNGQATTVKYRYDTGANVEATSPAPAGQTYGKTIKRVFDSKGRVQRESVLVNASEQAYTRYEFPSDNGVQIKQFQTRVNVNGDVYIHDDETLTETWLDGAGRVRRTASDLPNSPSGGRVGIQTEYDMLGRIHRVSVPTEFSVSGAEWVGAGDDLAHGFIYNSTFYDWKGRVTRTRPSDWTSSDGDDKDTIFTYEGCGCGGGQTTTVQGPKTTAADVGGTVQTAKRRWQKSYQDTLGRNYKTEILDLDGANVYSTVKTTFNLLDQPTLVREYSGTDTSSTYQDTTMSYDGHGRLYQSHKPQQFVGSTVKYTTNSYNPDDSIASVTDGRGVVTNYTYNNRGFVTNIGWDVGSTGITDPTDVTFTYDNAGNRTAMTDDLGSVSYSFNSLSQMTDETRDFSDTIAATLPAAPITGGKFKLEYTYHVGGQLKSYKDPFGEEIIYKNDKAGRLTQVDGSSYAGFTTYASGASYRAWGGLKHLNYANGVQMDVTFNNRLQPMDYDLVKNSTNIMRKGYQYNNDGLLKFVDDEMNGVFDRSVTYDHVGRMKEGKSGAEASGTTVSTNQDTQLPYRQSYSFNAFNNLTQRNNLHWGVESITYGQSNNLNYTYANNRITNTDWEHDADGRVTETAAPDEVSYFTYDARGLLTFYHAPAEIAAGLKIGRSYSGDNLETKRTKEVWTTTETPPYGTWEDAGTIYYLRSSVLKGQVISEVWPNGAKKNTFVLAAGAQIATQSEYAYGSSTTEAVSFSHTDASGLSARTTDSSGASISSTGSYEGVATELDPAGGSVGLASPYVAPITNPQPTALFPYMPVDEESPTYVNGSRVSMRHYGMSIPLSVGLSMLGSGAAQVSESTFGLAMIGIFRVPGQDFEGSQDEPFDDPNSDFRFSTYTTPDQYFFASTATTTPAVPVPKGMSCEDALKQAGKTQAGLERAKQILGGLSFFIGSDIVNLLGAIALQESDALNVKQIGGGPGRGVFQIEPKPYGISEQDAMNPARAAAAIVQKLTPVLNDIYDAMNRAGYNSKDYKYWGIAGLARVHNRWRPGVVFVDGKGNVRLGSLLEEALKTLKVTPLDNPNRSTDKAVPETAHGTYVRNVMDLYFSCF